MRLCLPLNLRQLKLFIYQFTRKPYGTTGLDVQLNETLETIKNLTPNCDKYDYILSASSGALCGILDVFLVGKPGESSLGDMTDTRSWKDGDIPTHQSVPI